MRNLNKFNLVTNTTGMVVRVGNCEFAWTPASELWHDRICASVLTSEPSLGQQRPSYGTGYERHPGIDRTGKSPLMDPRCFHFTAN
jgi:hypothetical protein